MDSIDQELLEAWNRISRETRQKRIKTCQYDAKLLEGSG